MPESTHGAAPPTEVDEFLASLDHPMAEPLADLRSRIVAAAPAEVVENVKWNAPNYSIGGIDRVTLGVDPRGRMRVVLHRGVKVIESDGFTFEDDSGLITWAAADRGVITIVSPEQYTSQADAIIGIVARWLRTSPTPG
jgi:Domain of unknown function (DU1801)